MFQSQAVCAFMVRLLLEKVDDDREELESLIKQNIELWCQELYCLPFGNQGICARQKRERIQDEGQQPGSQSAYRQRIREKINKQDKTHEVGKQKVKKVQQTGDNINCQAQKLKIYTKIEENSEKSKKYRRFEKLEEKKDIQNGVCSKVKKNLRFEPESNEGQQILRDMKYGNKLRFSRMSSKKSLYSHEGKDQIESIKLANNPIKIEYRVSQQKVIKSKSLKEPQVRPANILKKQQGQQKQQKIENKVKYKIQLQSQKNDVLVLKNSSNCLSKLYLGRRSTEGKRESREKSNKGKPSYLKADKQNKHGHSNAGQIKLMNQQGKYRIYMEEGRKKGKKYAFGKENKNLVLVHNHQKLIDIISNQQKHDNFYHPNYKLHEGKKS